MNITWLHARFVDFPLEREIIKDALRESYTEKTDINDLVEKVDQIVEDYTKMLRKHYKLPNASLFVDFSKDSPHSITWEVVNTIQLASANALNLSDIPFMMEFLNTPPGKELDAWADWEKYWQYLRRAAET